VAFLYAVIASGRLGRRFRFGGTRTEGGRLDQLLFRLVLVLD
jgi:hypothetical protein